jgi:hypothetical protein
LLFVCLDSNIQYSGVFWAFFLICVSVNRTLMKLNEGLEKALD